MEEIISTLVKAIRRTLSSARHSLDFPPRARDFSERNEVIEANLALERLRLSFPFNRMSTLQTGPFLKELADFNDQLAEVINNPRFELVVRQARFRFLPSSVKGELSILGFDPDERPSVYDGLTRLYGATRPAEVSRLLEPEGGLFESDAVNRLRSIIPPQKIAPLRFAVSNGQLALADNARTARSQDAENVITAKRELMTQGSRTLQELERSNCDRRLLDSLQYLQESLSGKGNIVRLGLANLTAGVMCDKFREELPAAVASMLDGYTRGVDLYISQFPEWNRFLENAGTVKLERSDVVETHRLTKLLIDDLTARSDLVDPQVPRTLARLNQVLQTPGESSKRAAFAILRSIENMVSSIFSYGVDFLAKTGRKISDDMSSAASKAVVVTLLTLALGGALTITPVAGKISEMAWLKNAVELVENQIKRMKAN
jgi:hypothetical protein